MHHYPRHVGDYIRDTAALSILEHGVYGLLLDHAYSSEAPLPLDPEALFRIVRARNKAETDAVTRVVGRYFTATPEGYTHKRVQAEIEKYRLKAATNKKAAGMRWHTQRNANALPTINQ